MTKTMNKARRGTVLILVIGILAVLMLMGATLALLSRVELRVSRYYETVQAIDIVAAAVQGYCASVLHDDKFGGNGLPYDYERLAAALLVNPNLIDSGLYPGRSGNDPSEDGLCGDDEGFDSPAIEEWLPGTGDWRLFNNPAWNNADLIGDSTPDAIWQDAKVMLGRDYGALMGRNVTAQFAVFFEDLGGKRIDINSTGNIEGTSGSQHNQSQGLTPFESSLEAVINSLGGNGAAGSLALVKERYGTDSAPGRSGEESPASNLLGTTGLDFDANGVIGNSDETADEPTEFNPDCPSYNSSTGVPYDRPFGLLDLYDLFWGENNGSRAFSILTGAAGLAAPNLKLKLMSFTTDSGGTVLASRCIRGGGTVFNDTAPANLASYAFMDYWGAGSPITSPTTKKNLLLQRAMQNGVAGITPVDLYNFLSALGPVFVTDPPLSTSDAQVLLRQIAVNLIDMVDQDSIPTEWDDRIVSGGITDRIYYGVEPNPYIAEVEAAIKTSNHPFVPDPVTGSVAPSDTRSRAKVPGPGVAPTYYRDIDSSLSYTLPDEVWLDTDEDGKYDDGEQQLYFGVNGTWDTPDGSAGDKLWPDPAHVPPLPALPTTGWGKYIKLVNPWNVDITMANDYRLYFPLKGQGWVLGDHDTDPSTPPEWFKQDMVIGTPVDPGDPTNPAGYIELSGTIPAHGHFVVIDEKTDELGSPVYPVFAVVPPPNPANYQISETLAYMRCGDPSDPQGVRLQAKDSGGAWHTVMDTTYPESSSLEQDSDNLGTIESCQIEDPRPCYWRGGSLQASGWDADAWVTDQDESAADWQADSTGDLGWFNRAWCEAADPEKEVGSGDNWFKLYAADITGAPSNVNNLLHSFPPVEAATGADAEVYSGVPGYETKVMNIGKLASPGWLGFAHAGISWGTLSLGYPATPGDFGEAELAYLHNFPDYLVGPVSPFENSADDDNDGLVDDDGTDPKDRFGAEIRERGRVNVNTASTDVLKALFNYDWLQNMWKGATSGARAEALATAIRDERDPISGNGPFSSVDDLFQRVPQIFEVDLDGDNARDTDQPNAFRSEALARFMYNLVTVHTDVYAAVIRVRLSEDTNGDGIVQADEIVAEKGIFIVLDRSCDPIRVVLRRELPY